MIHRTRSCRQRRRRGTECPLHAIVSLSVLLLLLLLQTGTCAAAFSLDSSPFGSAGYCNGNRDNNNRVSTTKTRRRRMPNPTFDTTAILRQRPTVIPSVRSRRTTYHLSSWSAGGEEIVGDSNDDDDSNASSNSSDSVVAKNVPYASISSLLPSTEAKQEVTTTETTAAMDEVMRQEKVAAAVPVVVVSEALQRLYDTVAELQQAFGSDAIAIVPDDDDDEYADNDDAFIAVVDEDDDSAIQTINSLVFQILDSANDSNDDTAAAATVTANDASYVLVVIGAENRVDVKALEKALSSLLIQHGDGSITSSSSSSSSVLALAPTTSVEAICGFAPGTVPPVGLSPEPAITVIDESLLSTALQQQQQLVRGGGGLKDQSCLVSIDVLLLLQVQQQQQQRVIVAAVAESSNNKIDDESTIMERIRVNGSSGTTASSSVVENTVRDEESLAPLWYKPKPFFAVAPPGDYMLAALQEEGLFEEILDEVKTHPFGLQQPSSAVATVSSFVGRIAGVRRMARELAFCDLVPPGVIITAPLSNNDDDDDQDDFWPWRNPVNGEPMAVQLIAGKTLCQTTGSDEAIRRLQKGQLVLVQGRTSVGTRDSLRNWVTKRVFDVVVLSYQLLHEEPSAVANSLLAEQRKVVERRGRALSPPASPPVNPEKCLRLKDLYAVMDEVESSVNGDRDAGLESSVASHVVLVDDMQSVKIFTKDLSQLLTSFHPPKSNEVEEKERSALPTVGLVGIDCEWQPTFLLPSTRDPQPVLLLQVCLHPLKRIYLFDMQTLLRPMMPPSQSMDKLEREVSFALGALFESKRLIKVGFQVVHDLRQLAASYPHIPTLHFYNAVLESSTLGKKAIRMAGSGDAREATSSLSRLVDQFIGKPLNKQEQCSDWSKRPLSDEQIEYASLDAAVTPIMVEKMITDLDLRARFFWEKPQLGRWENDTSFKKAISSWRFVFVHTTDFNVQRKLKAKRVVGDPLVVSQSWITGEVPPKLPAVPENGLDGPYTDITGVVQVPSASVTIRSTRIDDIIDSMIGERVGKSKDKCVAAFFPPAMPEGAKLDYPQRSGYVEFRDGVALFVNMPSTPGGRFQPRSYPNQWLNGGRILTWFLRENEWQHGTSVLAKKLVSSPNNVIVTVFVRLGSTGAFLCCGRCRVQDPLNAGQINGDSPYGPSIVPDNWTLVKLHLVLLDWNKLQSSTDFQALLNPDGCNVPEPNGKLPE